MKTENVPIMMNPNDDDRMMNPFVKLIRLSDKPTTSTEPEELSNEETIVKRESDDDEVKPILQIFLPGWESEYEQKSADEEAVVIKREIQLDESALELKLDPLSDVKMKTEQVVGNKALTEDDEESIPKEKIKTLLVLKNQEEITKQRGQHLCDTPSDSQPDCIPKANTFTCVTCGKSFNRKENLKTHLLVHSGVKPFTCETCGKSCNHKANLSKHLLMHTGVKPFTCATCGKSFNRKVSLKKHLLIHSGVKPFTCVTCCKTFNRKENLKVHLLVHTGIRPYTCETCGKSFNHKGNIMKHLVLHKGVKSMKCETCGKSFYDKWSIKKHMVVHTAVKPFTCATCGKSFNRKVGLKQHLLIHTGVKPFTCEQCGKSFNRKVSLKKHLLIHTVNKLSPVQLLAKH